MRTNSLPPICNILCFWDYAARPRCRECTLNYYKLRKINDNEKLIRPCNCHNYSSAFPNKAVFVITECFPVAGSAISNYRSYFCYGGYNILKLH